MSLAGTLARLTAPLALTLALASSRVAPVSALDPTAALQDYSFASWTAKDGLSSNLIWAAVQDRRGYIWFGTDAGLVRFDGVRFVTWDDLGRPSLPATSVRGLLVSRAGELWIGFGDAGGVVRVQDSRVTKYGAADGVPHRAVALLEDFEGSIWAGGLGGLSRFRNGRWEHIGGANGLDEQQTVMQLYEDRHQTLWVVVSGGAVYRRSPGSELEALKIPVAIRSVAEGADGDMVFATDQSGLITLDTSGRHHPIEPLPGLNVRNMLLDRDANLWIGTQGQGLWRIAAGRTDRIRVQRLVGEPTLSNTVRSLLQDREGNIWVGTHNGVTRLSDRSLIQMSSAGTSQNVRAVTVTSDGVVWAGTEDGLYRYRSGGLAGADHFGERHGLPDPRVTALSSDPGGALWAATATGMVRFSGNRFEPVPLPSTIAMSRIWAMTIDAEGGLWMCDIYKGLFLWKDHTLTSYEEMTGIREGLCTSAITDRSRRVWIGFSDGSVAVHENGRFHSYSPADGLPGGSVSTIAEDHDGAIWVGTTDGLGRFDAGRFASVSGRDGSPIVNVREIAFDENGYIWLGVSSGIVRFHGSEFDKVRADPTRPVEYNQYNAADGLRGLPMLPRGYPTATRDREGVLWFVTSDGLATVDARRVRGAGQPPPVMIERVTADEHPVDLEPDATLPPLTSRIQIDYTALSFANPLKTRFRYQLEGFDPGWIEAGTKRQAYYTNLPPRHYQFRVLAGNEGAWNEAGAVWRFSIRPTFYQTRWFGAASLVTIAMGVLLAWRLRVRRVRRHYMLVLNERARMARDIHDTLLQSLQGVAFQFDVLESELGSSIEAARRRIERLRVNVGMYIREAQQSIWDLRSPSLEAADLPKAMRRVVDVASHDSAASELLIDGTPYALAPRVEEVFLRVAQEATSNAVRHGQAAHVKIELSYLPDSVILRVVDDGRGFDLEAQVADYRAHWGLAIMEERARQIGAQFRIISTRGRGTEIELIFSASSQPRA